MESGDPSQVEVTVQPSRMDNTVHSLQTDSPASAAPRPPPWSLQWSLQRNRQYPSDEFRPFRSRRCPPWLVPAFVVANAVLFAITMYVNNCPRRSTSCLAGFLGRFSFQPFKQNPMLGPSLVTLRRMGALEVNKVIRQHQWWRLISCIWLHAGVFHILANMLSLLFIGIRLEQEFGFVRIGLLYVISGFGGSLLSALFIRSGLSVGASGAICGLLGSLLSELIINWTIYSNKFAALLTLIFIIVSSLAGAIFPHVDNFGHIGGFISGFLLGFVFLIRPQFGWVSRKSVPSEYRTGSTRRKHKTYQYVLWVLALVLLIVGFISGIYMLSRGVNGNDHCSWCHYLSCIPTPKWSCKSSSSSSVRCLVSQNGSYVSLICDGIGKSQNYTLPGATKAQLSELCGMLCT